MNIPPQVEWNTRVLMEPRGFIRIIQFFLAILAFATCSDSGSSGEIAVACKGVEKAHIISYSYSYPFNVESTNLVPKKPCDPTNKDFFTGTQNKSGAAQFYVFVGVMAFLYCIATPIIYVIWHDTYEIDGKLPIIDFGISIVECVLWFISSCIWSAAVGDLKAQLEPEAVLKLIGDTCTGEIASCNAQIWPNFTKPTISAIFGFLNCFVWGFGVWFIYKETIWHKSKQPDNFTNPATAGAPQSGLPQPAAAGPGFGDQPPLQP